MSITRPIPSIQYLFHTKSWESPLGDVIPGEVKRRTFLRRLSIGPKGRSKIPFFEVSRADGSTHLIAVETIDRIELAP